MRNLPALGSHLTEGFATGVADDDDHLIVTGDGDVFSVDNEIVSHQPANLDLDASRILAHNETFADGDHQIVVFEGTGPNAGAALVNWRTGAATQLGVADREEGAGGDRTEAGAYVSVSQTPLTDERLGRF